MKETLEQSIAEFLNSGKVPNQSELARKFGVSRSTVSRAIKKQALSVAGEVAENSEVAANIERYEVAATENGAVSATPHSTAPAAVGDTWCWGKDSSSLNHGLVVGVDVNKKMMTVAKLTSEKQLIELQVTSYKNWRKRPNLKHNGVEHNFIAAQALAIESGRLVASQVAQGDDAWYGERKGRGILLPWDDILKNEIKPYNYGLTVDTEQEKEIEVTDTSQIEVEGSRVKGAMKSGQDCPFKLTVSKRSITAVIGGEVLTVTADEASFEPCAEAVRDKNWEAVENFCRMRNKKAIDYQEIISRCGFKVQGGYVVMNNGTGKVALGGIDTIIKRLNSLALEGNSSKIETIGRFVDKVLDNPDPKIMNRIVDFIKFADVEIDDDGDLITYKYVDSNYLDSHSRTLDNPSRI